MTSTAAIHGRAQVDQWFDAGLPVALIARAVNALGLDAVDHERVLSYAVERESDRLAQELVAVDVQIAAARAKLRGQHC